jgi:acyl-ACP thioesterase
MDYNLTFNTAYFSLDADYAMRHSSLLRLLQEAAILHADEMGLGEKAMADLGLCWVLYRLELDVRRYPRYREKVRVVTRLGGRKGVKAYRHFDVFCADEQLASAFSVWFALDMASRRPVRFKGNLAHRLCPEGMAVSAAGIDLWKPKKDIGGQSEVRLTTRCADIDTNGHVNNAIYADYVETALARRIKGRPRFRSYRVQFNHEIAMSIPEVRVALAFTDPRWFFQIFAGATNAAVGEVRLFA